MYCVRAGERYGCTLGQYITYFPNAMHLCIYSTTNMQARHLVQAGQGLVHATVNNCAWEQEQCTHAHALAHHVMLYMIPCIHASAWHAICTYLLSTHLHAAMGAEVQM